MYVQFQNGIQPAKRKRALLASNPLKNNRSEARRGDEQRGETARAPPPGRYASFSMPEKTLRSAHDILADFTIPKLERLS